MQPLTSSSSDRPPEQLLAQIADDIYRRGLSVPAIFFLEMYKPLTLVFHSAVVVGLPLLRMCLGSRFGDEALRLLESHSNIEELIVMIEAKNQRVTSP